MFLSKSRQSLSRKEILRRRALWCKRLAAGTADTVFASKVLALAQEYERRADAAEPAQTWKSVEPVAARDQPDAIVVPL